MPGVSPGPALDAILIRSGERLDPTEVDSDVVLVWGASYLGLDAAPTLTVSGVWSAAMPFQRGVEAFHQGGAGKGLAQEASCAGLQRSGADALIREGRYEDERRTITLGAQKDQQVQTAHGRHLDIRNHTRRVIQVDRLQELLGRCKCMDEVPVRTQKIVRRRTDGCVIVNDGDNRKR